MNNRVTIIAEAGVNHNGDIETGRMLIDAAAGAGADYVKFQAFKADKLVSHEAKKADYQIRNTKSPVDDRQYAMLKELEADEQFHRRMMAYARKKKIGFLSSPFDEGSIMMLSKLGMQIFKVPSGEITNLPYLQTLARLKPQSIILSTGMSTLGEVEQALSVLARAGAPASCVTVLHCNTDYPTAFSDVNLRAMQTIAGAFGVEVGYSDHTPGIEVPVAAAAMGAAIIEKHFTISRKMEGPDHKASLEPQELKEMVTAIRNIEQAMGDGIKRPSQSESKNRHIVRKSIHLNCNKLQSSKIEERDIIMLRPGDGISPMKLPEVLNRKVNKELKKGHKLSWADLIL